jgi:hypothetical protein
MISQARLALLVGCLVLAGCGAAQDPPQRRLFESHNLLREAGFPVLGPISTGEVSPDHPRTLRAMLYRDACYLLAVFGGDGLADVGVTVGEPDETPLAEDVGTGRTAVVSFCAEREGEHQVTVTAASGAGEFAMAYWLAAGDGAGPGGGGGGGASIALGRPVQGTLAPGQPYLDYALTIDEPRMVVIDLQSSDFDAFLYLLQGGSELDRNDDSNGLNSQITRFLEPGTYTVRVSSFMEQGSGRFTLVAR